jgi:uncharacterized phage-associated protein/DNA-binding transcriptional regulator YiaG
MTNSVNKKKQYPDSDLNFYDANQTEIITRLETRRMGVEELEITLEVPVRVVISSGIEVSDPSLDNKTSLLFVEEYRKLTDKFNPEQIKDLRKKIANISQRGLANLVGWSNSTIERYESGSAPSPVNNKILDSLQDVSTANDYFLKSDKTRYSKMDYQKLTEFFVLKEDRAPFAIAKTVADWFVAENIKESFRDPDNVEPMTQMLLHKLTFLSQVFYSGKLNGALLFSEDTLAFRFGPFYESIRDDFHYEADRRHLVLDKGEQEAILSGQTEIEKTKEVREVLQEVWQKFGRYSAYGLVQLTHQSGTSWSKNYEPMEDFRVIPNSDIKNDYYIFKVNHD